MKWTIVDDINAFYHKLWKLHEDGALDSNDDKIALEIINAIDNALGR